MALPGAHRFAKIDSPGAQLLNPTLHDTIERLHRRALAEPSRQFRFASWFSRAFFFNIVLETEYLLTDSFFRLRVGA